jgi:hypothetical protein
MLGSNSILLITLSFNFLNFVWIEITTQKSLTFKKIYDFCEMEQRTKRFWEGYLIILKTMSIYQN